MALPSFATADDFADYTGLTDYDETRVTTLLTRASSSIRVATGQTISRVEDDEFSIPMGAALYLPERPADQPSAITWNGQSVQGFTLQGQQLRGLWWSDWWGYPLVVTYSHGFTEIPEEIRALTCELVARTLQNPDGYRTEQVGNWQATYALETVGTAVLTKSEIMAARRAVGIPTTRTVSLSS